MCAKRACRAFRQNCMLALLACVRPGTKRRAVLCITRLPPRKCTLPTVAAARLRAEHQYNALKEKPAAATLGNVGRKKNLGDFLRGFLTYIVWGYYIMPPIPPPPIGGIGAGFSSFLSAITHSVDRNIPATEAAF